MRLRLGLVVALLGTGLALSSSPAAATFRNRGTLTPSTPETSWTGTLGVSNPVDCVPVRTEPLCDHTQVDINAPGRNVEVVLTPNVASDQLALWVYDSSGKVVASSSTLGSTERVALAAPPPGRYDIATQSVLAPGGGRYHAVVRLMPVGAPVDNDPPLCSSDSIASVEAIAIPGVPAIAGTPFVTDDGRNVFLDVYVVLDGVTRAKAEAALAKVAGPYAPLGITVRGLGYEPMTFASNESGDIITAARRHFGGHRPPGSDLVLVITTKNITALGIDAVAGQADCISGVTDPARAFMVAEAAGEGEALVPDFAAKTTAHEMGHLMGGQHHLANCVEGIDPAKLLDLTPCTLMFNDVSLLTMKFSTINGWVVRGHALRYAQP